jgi:hypothetical protein
MAYHSFRRAVAMPIKAGSKRQEKQQSEGDRKRFHISSCYQRDRPVASPGAALQEQAHAVDSVSASFGMVQSVSVPFEPASVPP